MNINSFNSNFMSKIIMIVLVTVANTNASNCSTVTRSFINLHFGADYYGRNVKSVMAHIGSVIDYSYGGHGAPKWSNPQNIELEISPNGFFAKKIDRTTNASVYFPYRGTKVVYFIKLDNNEDVITSEFAIPVKKTTSLNSADQQCYQTRGAITDQEVMCSKIKADFELFKSDSHFNVQETSSFEITQMDC
jgi:hypothetical protein